MLLFHDGGWDPSKCPPERYLNLAAEDIQICVPSTPVQCFHMLRRLVLRKWRKPLVVMSPKSFLTSQGYLNSRRARKAVSCSY